MWRSASLKGIASVSNAELVGDIADDPLSMHLPCAECKLHPIPAVLSLLPRSHLCNNSIDDFHT